MANNHGVYVDELPSSVNAPVESDETVQVVFGVAPVNMAQDPYKTANTPILVRNMAQAQQEVGYSTDFRSYTICGSVFTTFALQGTGPMILINVLNPNKAEHTEDVPEESIQVNNGTATLETKGLLLDKLVVKADDTPLTAEVDYMAAFNEDGTVSLVIASEGKGAGKAQVTVSGKRIAPEKIKASDIVGGVDVNGRETGIEVVRRVFPKLGMTPGLLLAPWFSKDPLVAAVLQAKTVKLNGVFRSFCLVDVDSSESGAQKVSDVRGQKEKQGISAANCAAVWLCPKVGEELYSPSAYTAACYQKQDALMDGVPMPPMSNLRVSISAACTEDGTEVLLDQEEANYLNDNGIVTFLNFSGWRLWGNETAAYPESRDPKDVFISARRFSNWDDNNFILENFGRVDMAANPRLRDAIVEQQNVKGAGYVARQICARYEMKYLAEDNPATSLAAGKVRFHKYMAPYLPAKEIDETVEFDVNAIEDLMAGGA